MRSFYLKEVIEPDLKRRNYLMRKLAILRTGVKPTKNGQELIRSLRRQLRATEGRTLYYRVNKGVKMAIGDHTTSKKNFLLSKDPWYLQDVMHKHRKQFKAGPKVVRRDKRFTSCDYRLSYDMVGGVMYKAGWFKDVVKPIKNARAISPKYPKTKDPYIGIELEYASNLTIQEVAEKLVEHDLHNDVRVMYDGSIRTNEIFNNKIEFCILTKWSDLHKTLERLRPIIFDKPQNFMANNSCGLHVHLDVRNDSPERVYKNLTSMQSVLFNLAAEHRRDNRYCIPVDTTDFDDVDHEADDAHYHAISKFSYFKHATIEVRIHESTLDLTQIEKWITLLKRIADYKGDGMKLGTFDTEFVILKDKVKLEPELVKYIEERK